MQANGKNGKGRSELTEESQLPSLTNDQLEVMRRFALLEASLEEMLTALKGVFAFDFKPNIPPGYSLFRNAETYFRVPEPGIVITREHIVNALERRRFELITERDLVIWATVLLMNDAYSLDPGDEDLIAEWLNDISFNLDPS
jgi:hypothetical protein